MKIMAICALCQKDETLKHSHIIPRFVSHYIKKNSATGFLRSATNPERRLQDGDKQYLLCGSCEGRFSKMETAFARKMFHPFQESGFQKFEYEEWLHYFISSVSWRNLYLDICGFVSTQDLPVDVFESLIVAEGNLRKYLLGEKNDIGSIENHIFFFDQIESAPEDISNANPHAFFRTSEFGYTLTTYDYGGGYYVFSNLAGILICTIIKRTNEDNWKNTMVNLTGGVLEPPQEIGSPLMGEVFSYFQEHSQKTMSESQAKKVLEQLRKNPDKLKQSNFIKYSKLDDRLRVNINRKQFDE